MKFFLYSHRLIKLHSLFVAVLMIVSNYLVINLVQSPLILLRLLVLYNLPLCLVLSMSYIHNIGAAVVLFRLGFLKNNVSLMIINAELSLFTSLVTVSTFRLLEDQLHYSVFQSIVLFFLYLMTLLMLSGSAFTIVNHPVLAVLLVEFIAIIDLIASVTVPDRKFHFIGLIASGMQFAFSLSRLFIYFLLFMFLYFVLSFLANEKDVIEIEGE